MARSFGELGTARERMVALYLQKGMDEMAARLPASLAGRFQEALDACEIAGKCDTPAVVVPAAELPRRVVHFDPAPPPALVADPATTGGGVFAWLAGKKGWVGVVVGLVGVALLAAGAMYVRKHFIRPMLFGSKGQQETQGAPGAPAGPTSAVPPPPVIPAFARRRVRFKDAQTAAPAAPQPPAVPARKPKKSQRAPLAVPQPPLPSQESEPDLEEDPSRGRHSSQEEDPGYEPL
jgi:hypothetical protein